MLLGTKLGYLEKTFNFNGKDKFYRKYVLYFNIYFVLNLGINTLI